ncbi:MAG: hypothetical protein NZ951_06970, partial [Dehalococcoidia bacterium]|nr:hypothetical protein [Dehalococcoidia bacterium]
ARVALPLSAFLFSLRGVAPAVSALLQTYGRWDVLEYHHRRGHQPRRLILARWDTRLHAPDPASILPPGAL